MIRFACPSCRKHLKADDRGAGRKISCPRCGQRLRIPPSAGAPEQRRGGPTNAGSAAPSPTPLAGQVPFDCPGCHCRLTVSEEALGTWIVCPKCETGFAAIADGATPVPVPPPVPPPSPPVPQPTAGSRATIRFACPHCQVHADAPAGFAGTRAKCPNCGILLEVPVPKGVMTDSPPPAPAPVPRQTSVPWQVSGGPFNFDGPNTDAGFEMLEQPIQAPQIRTPQKHSGLGIASFLIAVLVGGLDVILAVVVATNIAHSADKSPFRNPDTRAELEANLMAGGMSMICLNCMSIPLCLVGAGLGFVGLVAHKDQNHIFTWIGLIANGVVILGVVGLYVFASMLHH
jgi:transcription elongation factor Elf1